MITTAPANLTELFSGDSEMTAWMREFDGSSFDLGAAVSHDLRTVPKG